jgi:hypothetical protein
MQLGSGARAQVQRADAPQTAPAKARREQRETRTECRARELGRRWREVRAMHFETNGPEGFQCERAAHACRYQRQRPDTTRPCTEARSARDAASESVLCRLGMLNAISTATPFCSRSQRAFSSSRSPKPPGPRKITCARYRSACRVTRATAARFDSTAPPINSKMCSLSSSADGHSGGALQVKRGSVAAAGCAMQASPNSSAHPITRVAARARLILAVMAARNRPCRPKLQPGYERTTTRSTRPCQAWELSCHRLQAACHTKCFPDTGVFLRFPREDCSRGRND